MFYGPAPPMRLKSKHITFLLIPLLALTWSCSTKKNAWINRNYHNVNAFYNGFFNGNESYEEGMYKLVSSHKENYKKVLPIFIHGNETSAKTVYPDMDKAIKKASKVIQRHSMDIRGVEYCKWIDDAYMLIGKAYFMKREYVEARTVFRYQTKRYPQSNTYYDGQLWFAKNYIAEENYYEADRLLDALEAKKRFPEEHKMELYATRAHYFATQGKYDDAVGDLERAVLLCKKKKKQTRWMFILAQMYQETGASMQAIANYKEVARRNLNYELTFYAQLNRAFAYDAELGNGADVKETLLKMAKDDKNIEYLDQIYYGLADVFIKEGRDDRGITFLNMSVEASVNNNLQKGESYLRLADLYFEYPDYILAQLNYDSASSSLPDTYEDYERVVNMRDNLGEIVKNILTIQTEDSLQRLANLPEEDRLIFIEDYIAEELERKEAAEREKQAQRERAAAAAPAGMTSDPFAEGGAEWYFYNPNILTYGKGEFSRIWGSRANEDNWRRSDKSSTNISFDAPNGRITTVSTAAQDDPERYLEFLPLDSASMAASNAKIQKALYDLGVVYKEDMKDSKNAKESFEGLLSRYDSSQYHASTYYQLYRIYNGEQNSILANKYKNLILSLYPETDYAKVILNPNYFEEMADEKEALEEIYDKAYGYYSRGFHRQVRADYPKQRGQFEGNPLASKYDLLYAISTGYVTGKDSLILSLNSVKSTHAETEEAKEASRILAYLNGKENEVPREDVDYKHEPESTHLVLVVLPTDAKNDRLKIEIANFNAAYFRLDALKVQDLLLGEKNLLLTVKQFKSADKALRYVSSFQSNKTKLKQTQEVMVDVFAISYNNYPLFYKAQDLEGYQDFFDDNY